MRKPPLLSSVVFTEYGASAYSLGSRKRYFAWLEKTGSNTASLLMTCQTDNLTSHQISCDSENSPQQSEVKSFFVEAKQRNLNTSFRVYVDLLDGHWRALWNPKNKTLAFSNLETVLLNYARFCEAMQIDVFILGAEYEKLTQPEFKGQWESLIGKIRQIYRGRITYGANGNYSSYKKPEYAWVPFWEKLDYVGIDHYAPFAGTEPNEENFAKHHSQQIAKYQEATSKSGKPLFFNEVGFPLAANGHLKPYEWKWSPHEPLDAKRQSMNIKAFYKVAKKQKIGGIELWRWMPDEAKVYHGGYILDQPPTIRALKHVNSY